MEYFDILDRDGNPTGRVAAKGTNPKNGEYCLGVHAFIFNHQNQFLIQQRSPNKIILPGVWDIHLGHAMTGETSLEAVRREVWEEVGLSRPEENFTLIGRTIWDNLHYIIDVYALQTEFTLQKLVMQPSEVIGLKVVSLDEMLNMVSRMTYRPQEYRELITNFLLNLKQKIKA